MRKADLVNMVAEKTGMNKVDILLILENSLRIIKASVANKQTISIRGFGTFTTKKRAAKKARIIKKNIEINIPEKTIPYFKPSKEFLKLMVVK